MERLSGLDASFLYLETPTNHMHVAAVMVFDPSSAPGGYSFERVKEFIASRLHLITPFHRRLVPVPFNLAHPVWIEDPAFDLDYHIRRIAIPPPGGSRELAELAGDIASRQLDRTRPLWELWIVEGLQNGYVAAIAKMHHCTIDGVSGANLLAHLFDLTAEPEDVVAPEWRPERKPSDLELVAFGLQSRVRRQLRVLTLAPRTVAAVLNVLRQRRDPSTPAGATPLTAPRTSFNASITPHRKVALTAVPLAGIKAVKNAFGTTVNDVVLAICAGALRRYLLERDELPDRFLVATCPISVRNETDTEPGSNKISAMFVSLPTQLEDPVERLLAIRESTKGAKEEHKALGARMLQDLGELAAPTLFSLAARLYSSMKLADRHPVAHNLVISNVPGPPVPLYFAGSRLVALHPLGPVFDGAGLNITVLSYLDTVGFGLIACRELIPRLWDLAAAVEESAAELEKAAQRRVASRRSTRRARS
ncbi:MAG: wax ester/triacylglycerol synthase family O-acyltransferase [Acidimicrobiia bacterium]